MNKALRIPLAVGRFFMSGWWQKVVVFALIIGFIVVMKSIIKEEDPNQFLTVERGSIIQTVSVTGQVTAATSVDLAFGGSGRVAYVPASVGDFVQPGTLLASLENAELNAQYRDAQANVLTQQARLDELRRGTRLDEIAIKESEFNNALQNLQNAYDDIRTTLVSSYANANSGVRVQLDSIFDQIGTNSDPSFDLTFSCAGTCITFVYQSETLRKSVDEGLIVWSDQAQNLNLVTDEAKLDALQEARRTLQDAITLMDTLDIILNNGSVALPTDDINEYRTSVSTGRTSVSTALSSVTSQIQSVTTAQFTAERVASELALKKAGSTPQQIQAQEAILLSARAQVDRIGAVITKNLIRSPIAGLVTRQDAKPGETVSAGMVLVSVISDDQLQLEANIPEIDAGSVLVGDLVAISVDALQGLELTGQVGKLDPAETVIDGVISYKVTVFLNESDERMRSGLTTEMDIETDRRDGVLLLPQYAVIERDEGSFVELADGTEVEVGLGIWSQEGFVEVVSGLEEGDRVKNIGLKQAP